MVKASVVSFPLLSIMFKFSGLTLRSSNGISHHCQRNMVVTPKSPGRRRHEAHELWVELGTPLQREDKLPTSSRDLSSNSSKRGGRLTGLVLNAHIKDREGRGGSLQEQILFDFSFCFFQKLSTPAQWKKIMINNDLIYSQSKYYLYSFSEESIEGNGDLMNYSCLLCFIPDRSFCPVSDIKSQLYVKGTHVEVWILPAEL